MKWYKDPTTWGWVAVMLWVLMGLTTPNFGFVPVTNAETLGFNFGRLFLPIVGLILIVSGMKKKKKGAGGEKKESGS